MAGRSPNPARLLRWSGSTAVALVLVVLVAAPLTELVRVGGEELSERGTAAIDRAITGGAVLNTVWTSAVVAVLAVGAGLAAATLTERIRPESSGWLRIGIVLPLFVPGFVTAMSVIRAYGPSGLTDDLVGVAFPGLFGPAGIIAVLAVGTMPIAYLVLAGAIRSRAEPDLQRAARVHGATAVVATATVGIPLLAPALLGAGALVFVSAINAFGAPAVLGTPAGFATVTTRIYQDLALAARPEAFGRAILLALVLVAMALVAVLFAERLLGGLGNTTRTGAPAGQVVAVGRFSGVGAAAVWAMVILTTLGPLLALTLTALTRGVGLPPVPANWTLGNFAEALQGRAVGAFVRSMGLAALTASMAVALGAAIAALRNRRIGRVYRTVVLLTFAVPGSTLAVALLLAYGPPLRNTFTVILLAYLAKLAGVGHRVVDGSAGSLAPDLYRAARVAGASGWSAARTVLVPLLRPALVGGWMIVFIFAFHELTMSSLLYGPGTDTLAVVVLNLQQLGDVPVSSALAVLMTLPVLVVVVPLLAMLRLMRRRAGSPR